MTSSLDTERRSPVHDDLEARGAEWRLVAGNLFAVRLHDEPAEREAADSLVICDLSGLQKLGLKGQDAENWLSNTGLDVPTGILDASRLEDGGVIIRFGPDEFFLEEGVGNPSVATLADRLHGHSGHLLRVEHQEATFLLVGSQSLDVLAQTCGIDFCEVSSRQVVFTRVAGVNCAILPEFIGGTSAFRFWVDPSYAAYLWKVLVEISESLNGNVVGVGHLFPELLS